MNMTTEKAHTKQIFLFQYIMQSIHVNSAIK